MHGKQTPTKSITTDAAQLAATGQLSPEQQRELLAKLLREKAMRAKQFPMSIGQQGLWHAYRRDPAATPFNVFFPMRVRSRLDVEAIEKSSEWVAQRHACLRTTFSDSGGELQQQVHDDLKPEFSVVDCEAKSHDAVKTLIVDETLRPFRLEDGPLLRVLIYRLADDDWVILMLTHHIVVDFWSLMIVLDELRAAYPNFAGGQSPPLPAAPSNYADFVEQQQKLLDGSRGEELRQYWQRSLEGASPVIELPLDRIRPSFFSGRAGVAGLEFEADCVERIHQFATQNRATPFAVVQAALQVFIQRYSGQDAFFIGSPFAGRRHQSFHKTVGFFVNMLPLRADLRGKPTFRQLVARSTQTLLDALEHEDYPIARIVQENGIARDPARSPLFQVSCTFEKSHIRNESGRAAFLFPGEEQAKGFAGTTQESFYIPHQTCHYDIEFIFEQGESDLHGMLCYCRDLFDEQTIQQIANNFPQLLESLMADSDRPVKAVPWYRNSQAVAGRKIAPSNDVRATLSTIDSTLASSVACDGFPGDQHLAFKHESGDMSYRQFFDLSAKIAAEVRRNNVGPGSIVPVIARRGPRAFAALQGIHMAGAAFVPIDSDQPSIAIDELLLETQCPLIVTEDGSLAFTDKMPSICIDQIEQLTTPEPVESIHSVDDLAYVVYTSGSTGKPKGVMLDHRAVSNFLRWRAGDVSLVPSDRVLMLLSHQFDAGLGVVWTTLSQGATLVWSSDESRRDPNLLVEQIIRDEITVLPAPPSLLKVIISHPRFAECKSLRHVWTGGEPMPSELPEQLANLTKARFFNFYGPTEAAIESTWCEVTHHDRGRPVPIGKPIDETEILILDSEHRVVPDTVPGEIAIGGAGLARGYLNDLDLTKERFIVHPLDATGTARVYLTGDRGRRNAQGSIEFFGRDDHQIKLRGYRIELGEIEAVLQSHYLVDRAAVKVHAEGTDQAQLHAFVNLDDTIAGSSDESTEETLRARGQQIRRFVAEQLPSYKVPAAVMVLTDMPITSSGKVDRNQLPSSIPPELLQLHAIAPSTAIEKYLAEQWCEMLSIQQIGVNINFFEAGGSSLQAAMLTSKLSEGLAVHVPTALLFDLADIAHLANRLVELYPAEMTARFGTDCIEQQMAQTAAMRGDGSGHGSLDHPLIAALKPSGSRRPIFMVHPPGGIVVCYRELAMHLGQEQPLFGIRSRGLHGDEQLPQTIAEMARDYIDAIRSVQPHGPYTLGGWSLGGLAAYEMAQQLRRDGEAVDRLLLLDTTIPTGATELVPAEELVNVGREYGIEMTLEQLGDLAPEEQLPFLWDHAKKLGVLNDDSPPEMVAQVLEDLQSLFHHHIELAQGYQIESTETPIDLFRPTDMPVELAVSDDRGWSHLAPTVSVHFVSGHHHSMVQRPHVIELAKAIGQSVQRD